jgi:hypothetical protein
MGKFYWRTIARTGMIRYFTLIGKILDDLYNDCQSVPTHLELKFLE